MTSPLTPADLKVAIMQAIAAHIAEHGRKRWDLLREDPRYAATIGAQAGEAGRRKFFRWVKAVSEPRPADRTRPHEGRAVCDDAAARAISEAQAILSGDLAVPISRYLLRTGSDGARNLRLFEALDEIWDDAERLRRHALKADPKSPGALRIKSVRTFDLAIRRRLEVISAVVRLREEILRIDDIEQALDEIVDLIDEDLRDYPEIQQRVLARRRAIAAARGLAPQPKPERQPVTKA